jgi:hypothetical protein
MKKKKNFDFVEQFPHFFGTALPIVAILLAIGFLAPLVVKAMGVSTILQSAKVAVRSEASANALVTDPFSSEPAGRHYATEALEKIASQPTVVSEAKKESAKPESSVKALKNKTARQNKEVLCFTKKKKRNKEEKEIYDHIEAAKRRYPYFMSRYGEMTIDSCEKKGIEPDFGISLFLNEGGGNKCARSDSGALGLTQQMCRTAMYLWKKRHEKIPYNIDSALCVPGVSISLGTDYLKEGLDFYESPVKASIAYWAGTNGVYNYFCKYRGKDVDVEYYRIVYGIYKWIKEQKGEECSPAMKPAKPPEIDADSETVRTVEAN